jgi:ABC-type histidine transport system ATPase subunit
MKVSEIDAALPPRMAASQDSMIAVRGLIKRIGPQEILRGVDLEVAVAKTLAIIGRSGRGIWQRGFFDRVIRNDESYSEKWNYVRENPVRAGLAAGADDWPF